MTGTEADKPTCTLDDFFSEHSKPVMVVKVDDSRTEGPQGWLDQIKERTAAVHPGLVNFFKKLYGKQLDGVAIPVLSEQQIKYYSRLVYEETKFRPNIQHFVDEKVEPCNFPHTIYLPAGSVY